MLNIETPRLDNWIDGKAVAAKGNDYLDLVNPVDGSVTSRAPISTAADVDAAMRAAKAAFGTWRKTPPRDRQNALLAIAAGLEAHTDELVEAQCRNTGQPRWVIANEEIVAGADQLRFFAGAARVMEGKSAGEYTANTSSMIRREPVGVIAQVTPWNYPFLMAAWKIGAAVAAGNTVVLKPSETTPESTLLFARIASEHLPDGVFNVVLGERSTGRLLVEHPTADMVALTGSVRAGIEVATSAAGQLKRIHLELGGKAPALVFSDADLDSAAKGIAEAAFFNAGQDCVAATRVLVHKDVEEAFVERLVNRARETITGKPDDPDTFYGPLNNAAHFQRVQSTIDSLPEHISVLTGGTRVGDHGYFFAPTVLAGARQDDEVVQREIFGPVLTVQTFDSDEQALTLANGIDYALAASVWTTNHTRATAMSADLDFGVVWINAHMVLAAEMPHGGFKLSGYGKDMSAYGLEDYTRIKHVMTALK